MRHTKQTIVLTTLMLGSFTGAFAQSVWTARTSGTTNNLNSVDFYSTQYVAVGASGTIRTSPDGITWTAHNAPSNLYTLHGVVSAGSQVVAVGNYSLPPTPGAILTSPDAVTWTTRTSGTGAVLRDVAYTGSQLVTVGDTGNILTSPTGVTWTKRIKANSAILNSVTWQSGTNAQLVAAGELGIIETSPDGVTWLARSGSSLNSLNAVASFGGQLVAVGAGGIVSTSPDGVTWTTRTSGTTNNLNSVAYMTSSSPTASGTWVAVGDNGTILSSADGGVTWTTENSGTTSSLSHVTTAINGTTYQMVAVGSAGIILTSELKPTTPTLSSPANNATGLPIADTLKWANYGTVTAFRLQVSTDSTFATTRVNDSTLTGKSRLVTGLANNTLYYWRVNAKNPGGTSAYSAVSHFRTVVGAGILPDKFSLQSLNLENGKTLRFALPQRTRVIIQLFNSQGRMISQLLDETRDAGNYTLPVSHEAPGSYYLDFRAGDVHKTVPLQQ